MKKLFYTLLVFSLLANAQAPSGYYNSANGLTGYALKTELKNIISNGYNAQSYSSLIGLYDTSDNDAYYDNGTQTNTILDIYSEIPNGNEPYLYFIGSNSNCGNFNSEGDCYNREHIFPQGFFSQNEPMRSDAHHVIPTDGFVNGGRGSLPFGRVNPNGASITTYSNGTRRGPSITPGFSGTVFEPIDEFKGDVARMLLYFATRYEDNINDTGWDNPSASVNNPRDGSADRFYEQWYIDLLLDWHAADPVSQREIDRNDDIYVHQNNRNPYIDNPQYVTMIWTASNTASGELFATLTGTYMDTNANNMADAGDEIIYEYAINNIGSTTLYNVTSNALNGTFNNGMTPIPSIAPGTNLSNPYGTLTYTLTASDVPPNNPSCMITNQLTIMANFNAAGTNGTLNTLSDDPNDFANVDSNNDNLPDDITEVEICQNNNPSFTTLFISEYVEGSSNNKAIELSNWTGATVNLAGYSLMRQPNGSGAWDGEVQLIGSVADQDAFVVARGAAGPAILAETDQTVGSGLALDFNGNDPVGLFLNGNLIDIVGDFDGGSTDFAANETLVRKPNVQAPKVPWDKSADWEVFSQDDITDLGQHDAVTLSQSVIELTEISIFPNPSNGYINIEDPERHIQSIELFDLAGRRIQDWQANQQIYIADSGIYLLVLNTDAGSISKKLVVR
ncbi:endonuclease [Nonlabens xiamenensis]|uniref:endonuclease n=1 Tax=Nonlabens xiamenensis TaxID=2341043 RepID=UPI000F610282|nr:endonuclease [Nonlabens xiamenensis]